MDVVIDSVNQGTNQQAMDLFAQVQAYADPRVRELRRHPYVIERKTGFVHVNTEEYSNRPDLVVGCWNTAGSFNEEDAVPGFDPMHNRVGDTRELQQKILEIERSEDVGVLKRIAHNTQQELTQALEYIKKLEGMVNDKLEASGEHNSTKGSTGTPGKQANKRKPAVEKVDATVGVVEQGVKPTLNSEDLKAIVDQVAEVK